MCLLLDIENGCINQDEIKYNTHSRARNWVATVIRDVTKPGKLDRDFWKSHGTHKEIPRLTLVGEVIEVGFDYYSGRGRKSFGREYYKISKIDKESIGLELIGIRVTKKDFTYENT